MLIVGQMGGIVDRDNDLMLSNMVSSGLLGGNVLSFLDDPGVEVVMGHDFVERWQGDALSSRVLKDCSDEGLDELSLVDVDTGPCGGVQEGLVVLGAQQDPVEDGNFLAELTDGVGVDGTLRLYKTGLHGAYIVFHEDRIFVLLVVGFDVIGVAENPQLFVRDRLSDMLQQLDDILLLLQKILIGCGKKRRG